MSVEAEKYYSRTCSARAELLGDPARNPLARNLLSGMFRSVGHAKCSVNRRLVVIVQPHAPFEHLSDVTLVYMLGPGSQRF